MVGLEAQGAQTFQTDWQRSRTNTALENSAFFAFGGIDAALDEARAWNNASFSRDICNVTHCEFVLGDGVGAAIAAGETEELIL